MSDNIAAFKQQLEKLEHGGELQFEYCGMLIQVTSVHGIYIIMTKLWVSPDLFYDFLQSKQHHLQNNEQYLIHQNKVYYCLFMKDIEFESIVNCTYAAVNCSMTYQ